MMFIINLDVFYSVSHFLSSFIFHSSWRGWRGMLDLVKRAVGLEMDSQSETLDSILIIYRF